MRCATIIVLMIVACSNSTIRADWEMYAAGFASDNVIRFDLDTGDSIVIFEFETISRPRGIAVDENGVVFVGLRNGSRNIKKLMPDGRGGYEASDLTGVISVTGSGLLALSHDDRLLVAGAAADLVFRVDPLTGNILDSFSSGGTSNLIGMDVVGPFVYIAELDSNSVFRFDLGQDPITGEAVLTASGMLNHPAGMTVGHNGNLFVPSIDSALVQEFDEQTGAFQGTFIDLSEIGESSGYDIQYVAGLQSYFVTTAQGSNIYRFNESGMLIDTYSNPALSAPYGITIVGNCTADLDGTGLVGIGDLLVLLAQWGPCPPDCFGDVNGDGTVDIADLLELLAAWGLCP